MPYVSPYIYAMIIFPYIKLIIDTLSKNWDKKIAEKDRQC